MKLEPESIFIHSLRTFFVSLFGVIGAMIGLGLILLLFVGIFSSSDENSLPSKAKILPDAKGNRKDLGSSAPVLLQIPIEGTIGMDQVTAEKIQEILLDSREDSLKNGRVKGVLLVINSPGGGANESNIIYRLLKQYKERYNVPIFAYVNGLCASGGYYIACSADKIYSSNVSLIGSVGVLGWPPYMNVSDALEKIGVNTKTIYAGKGKDEMNPFREWKEGEGVNRQQLIDFYYKNFVEIVTSNRPEVTEEKLIGIYGAEVFPAYEAQNHGFIDNSNMELGEAIEQLALAAGIEDKYQVIQFKTKSWWKQAFKQQSKSPLLTGKITHEFALPKNHAFDYLYVP